MAIDLVKATRTCFNSISLLLKTRKDFRDRLVSRTVNFQLNRVNEAIFILDYSLNRDAGQFCHYDIPFPDLCITEE